MLETGKKAPAFTLPAASGGKVSLKDFRGAPVILYFYPKDNTPGCTTEACDFRDNFARVTAAGAVVLGVSGDSVASHVKFRDKHDLPFELLSDESFDMLEKYGVWQKKKLYGRTFMGIVRTTVLIDGDGVVRRIWPKVRVKGHVDEVLEALAELS
ncbi:MAG: thioredoxin-dependent thiol peroxidase [Bacteroidota bacterium]|nr:thioredoxin-dependent thiol peroxidase [Bacteroidota bacterium]